MSEKIKMGKKAKRFYTAARIEKKLQSAICHFEYHASKENKKALKQAKKLHTKTAKSFGGVMPCFFYGYNSYKKAL